jgi:hypothetical protein
MGRLDDLLAGARGANIHLRVSTEHLDRAARLSADGMFHIPLLAMCMLVVAHAQRGTLSTADLAAWTGATLGRHFSNIQAAHRKLEWSLAHRRRCAEALVFLENVGLATVNVNGTQTRQVKCAPSGSVLLADLVKRGGEAGLLVSGLRRAYVAVEHRGLDLL